MFKPAGVFEKFLKIVVNNKQDCRMIKILFGFNLKRNDSNEHMSGFC